MLIYGHQIRPGDVIVALTRGAEGKQVKEVEIMEDNSVRVQYVTGATEWFLTQGLVSKREN